MTVQSQPSAQGIASLYTGNPGALQQRIQKEQQAKPGLPPDLKKLMALNIVTNEEDAFKRQKALNAVNQMAPAGQEPPTVAQSLQEQARQKAQARAVQEQRKQMAMRDLAEQRGGLAAAVPENTPQPEAQPKPQGIDELPVELGLAGGGIVSFATGEDVKSREERLAELTQQLAQMRPIMEAVAKSGDPRAIQKYGQQEQELRQEIAKLKGPEEPAAAQPESAAQRFLGFQGIASPSGRAALKDAWQSKGLLGAVEPLAAAPAAPAAAPAAAPYADEAARRTRPAPAAAPAAPAGPNLAALRGQINAAERRASPETYETPAPAPAPRPAAPRPALRAGLDNAAPAPTPAPANETPATPAKSLKDLVQDRLTLSDTERTKEMDRYKSMIPKPDTSQYDRLIAELESRKKDFNAPAAGFDAFAELMQQIAAGGPNRSWAAAGARGGMAVDALNKERKSQQFELTKQAIDIAQKKIDADRAYNKELYAAGDKGAQRMDKIAEETAKEMGLDRRNAETLANHIKVENMRGENQLAVERLRERSAMARHQPDMQTRLLDAMRRDDKPEIARIQKVMEMSTAAKKPGLDMEQVKKFENLPGVKADLQMLSVLRQQPNPKPATVQRIETLQRNLVAKAKANKIAPEAIGLEDVGGASQGGTGQRTLQWNDIK